MPAPVRSTPSLKIDLRQLALWHLCECDPAVKAAALRVLRPDDLGVDAKQLLEQPAKGFPGRPDRPPLVPPARLERRSAHTPGGRAALLHALAHIELNAVHLALDAVWRFSGLPESFYRDWISVAMEEANHFNLLVEHLGTLGFAYGDFPAHDGLWEMADRTRGDVLARMALVPRTLEARGLDASPALRAKLAQAGDQRAAEILDLILREEIGHVAIGNRWFGWLCAQRGLDPLAAFAQLQAEHRAPKPRGPFNMEARRAAGFSAAELELLVAADAQSRRAAA